MVTAQTLEDFLKAPFGEPEIKSNEFEQKYQKLKNAKRIQIAGYTILDENYMIHIKVGSDSNTKMFYDVVLLFFTDNPKLKKSNYFQSYYVNFFSNSPSFIYQYAALYKKNGYLIDALFDKMDKQYSDTMPEKANSTHKLSYDKSIYCACRFMLDHRVSTFSKISMTVLQKKKTNDAFFRDIKDFAEVKFSNELLGMEKDIDKKLKTHAKEKKEKKQRNRNNFHKHAKITATKSTLPVSSRSTKITGSHTITKNAKVTPKRKK